MFTFSVRPRYPRSINVGRRKGGGFEAHTGHPRRTCPLAVANTLRSYKYYQQVRGVAFRPVHHFDCSMHRLGRYLVLLSRPYY